MEFRVDISTLGKAPTRAVRRANWLALIVPLSQVGVTMEVEEADLISDGDTTVLTAILMQIYKSQKSWLAKVNKELALERKEERSGCRPAQTLGYSARLLAQQAAGSSHPFPGSVSTSSGRRPSSDRPTQERLEEPTSANGQRVPSTGSRELLLRETDTESPSACSRPPDRKEHCSPTLQIPQQGKSHCPPSCSAPSSSACVDETKSSGTATTDSSHALGCDAVPNESTETSNFSRIPKPRARRRASSSSARSSLHPSTPLSCNSSSAAFPDGESSTTAERALPPLSSKSAGPSSERALGTTGTVPFTSVDPSQLPSLSGTLPPLPQASDAVPPGGQPRRAAPPPGELCRLLGSDVISMRVGSPVRVVLSETGAETDTSESAQSARRPSRCTPMTSVRQHCSRRNNLRVDHEPSESSSRESKHARESCPQSGDPSRRTNQDGNVDGSQKRKSSPLGFSRRYECRTASQSPSVSASGTQSPCTKYNGAPTDTFDNIKDNATPGDEREWTPVKNMVRETTPLCSHKEGVKQQRCAEAITHMSSSWDTTEIEEKPRVSASTTPTRSTGAAEHEKHSSSSGQFAKPSLSEVSWRTRGQRRASTATAELTIREKTLPTSNGVRGRCLDTTGESLETGKSGERAKMSPSFSSNSEHEHLTNEARSKSDGSSSCRPSFSCEAETSSSSDKQSLPQRVSYLELHPHDATSSASLESFSSPPPEKDHGPWSPKLQSPKSVAKPARAHSSFITVRFAPPPAQCTSAVCSELPSSFQRLSGKDSSVKRRNSLSPSATPPPVSSVPLLSSSSSSYSSSYSSVPRFVSLSVSSPPLSDGQPVEMVHSKEKKEKDHTTAPAGARTSPCQAHVREVRRTDERNMSRAASHEPDEIEHVQVNLVHPVERHKYPCSRSGATSEKEDEIPAVSISRPSSSKELQNGALLPRTRNSSQSRNESSEVFALANNNAIRLLVTRPLVTGSTQQLPEAAAGHGELNAKRRCVTGGVELSEATAMQPIGTLDKKNPDHATDPEHLPQASSLLLDTDTTPSAASSKTATTLFEGGRSPFLAPPLPSQDAMKRHQLPSPPPSLGDGDAHLKRLHTNDQHDCSNAVMGPSSAEKHFGVVADQASNHDTDRKEVKSEKDGVSTSSRDKPHHARDQFSGSSALLSPEIRNHEGSLLTSDKRRARSCEEALVIAAERAFGLTWKEAVRAVKKKGGMWEEIQRIFSKDAPRFYAGLRLWAEDIVKGEVTTRIPGKNANHETAREEVLNVKAGMHSEERKFSSRTDARRQDEGGLLRSLVEGVARDWKKLSIVLEIFRRGAFFFGFPEGFLKDKSPPPSSSAYSSFSSSSSSCFLSDSTSTSSCCYTSFFSSSCSHLALFLRSLSTFVDLLLLTHPGKAPEHLLTYLQKSPSMATDLAFLLSASPCSSSLSSVPTPDAFVSLSRASSTLFSPPPSTNRPLPLFSSLESNDDSPPGQRASVSPSKGRRSKRREYLDECDNGRLEKKRFREKSEFLSICTIEAARLLALFSSRDPCFFVREMLPKCLRGDEEAFCRICIQILPIWVDLFEKNNHFFFEEHSLSSSDIEEEEDEEITSLSKLSESRKRKRDFKVDRERQLTNFHKEEERRRWIGALEYLADLCCNELSILTVLPVHNACRSSKAKSTSPKQHRGSLWREEDEEDEEEEGPDHLSLATNYLSLLRTTLLQHGGSILLRESSVRLNPGEEKKSPFSSSSDETYIRGQHIVRKNKKDVSERISSLDHRRKKSYPCQLNLHGYHNKTRRTLLQGLQCLANCLHPNTRHAIRRAAFHQIEIFLQYVLDERRATKAFLTSSSSCSGVCTPEQKDDNNVVLPGESRDRLRDKKGLILSDKTTASKENEKGKLLQLLHSHQSLSSLFPLLWESRVLSWPSTQRYGNEKRRDFKPQQRSEKEKEMLTWVVKEKEKKNRRSRRNEKESTSSLSSSTGESDADLPSSREREVSREREHEEEEVEEALEEKSLRLFKKLLDFDSEKEGEEEEYDTRRIIMIDASSVLVRALPSLSATRPPLRHLDFLLLSSFLSHPRSQESDALRTLDVLADIYFRSRNSHDRISLGKSSASSSSSSFILKTPNFKEEREKEKSIEKQQEEKSLPSPSPSVDANERERDDLQNSYLHHVHTQDRILSLLVHAAERSPALREGENAPSAFLCWVKGFFSRESSSSAFSEKNITDLQERKKKEANNSEGKSRQEGYWNESGDGEGLRLSAREDSERRKSERNHLPTVHAATKILHLMERRRETRSQQREEEEARVRRYYSEEKRVDLNENRPRLRRAMRDSRKDRKREEEEGEEDFLMKEFRALCVEYASRYPSSSSSFSSYSPSEEQGRRRRRREKSASKDRSHEEEDQKRPLTNKERPLQRQGHRESSSLLLLPSSSFSISGEADTRAYPSTNHEEGEDTPRRSSEQREEATMNEMKKNERREGEEDGEKGKDSSAFLPCTSTEESCEEILSAGKERCLDVSLRGREERGGGGRREEHEGIGEEKDKGRRISNRSEEKCLDKKKEKVFLLELLQELLIQVPPSVAAPTTSLSLSLLHISRSHFTPLSLLSLSSVYTENTILRPDLKFSIILLLSSSSLFYLFLSGTSLVSQETEKDSPRHVDAARGRRADSYVDVEVQEVGEEEVKEKKKKTRQSGKENKQGGEEEEGVEKQYEMDSKAEEEEECRLVLRCFKSTLDRLFGLLLKHQMRETGEEKDFLCFSSSIIPRVLEAFNLPKDCDTRSHLLHIYRLLKHTEKQMLSRFPVEKRPMHARREGEREDESEALKTVESRGGFSTPSALSREELDFFISQLSFSPLLTDSPGQLAKKTKKESLSRTLNDVGKRQERKREEEEEEEGKEKDVKQRQSREGGGGSCLSSRLKTQRSQELLSFLQRLKLQKEDQAQSWFSSLRSLASQDERRLSRYLLQQEIELINDVLGRGLLPAYLPQVERSW
ncbi:hypothetical protein CSUI_000406 [Cystoisospora suis]|uniref:Uncharacterized protein n=1 Tax=Cystoisospora suis TaxID=483139 RepID=A0A2C6LFL7_9APIC|nr:hypothetical protein CSUI_000406 [Cystoisospora suis]